MGKFADSSAARVALPPRPSIRTEQNGTAGSTKTWPRLLFVWYHVFRRRLDRSYPWPIAAMPL